MTHDSNKDFDGIRQENNPLPPWWKWIFVITILFSVLYAIYFHKFSNWEQDVAYELEVKEHETKFPHVTLITAKDGMNPLRNNPNSISEGEKTFKTICAACHGPTGQGLVGPSLMDKEWIHGSTDLEVYESIMKGITIDKTKLGRGPMPPHENSLGSEKVYEVMAWIASQNSSLKASR
ncbi:cbb3-type cytochrome c oxidase N-terminal domain-containing protein [Leptospira noguchii]|uniref:C-type cytochrome n=1 Tax=Leptospira noguchii TaxID=28182 RepID=A0A9Q8VRA5_9LEPT|nr:cbb3-type cytochrome c oxidase N-terminal domain-containing protein [Leptospira noguchii]TQE74353.1 c-type cytochrome [Leptospira noguchii]UOG33120.1 c-type cytochrome [Leptospira noguchii]UOG40369.1 c-type cytochrome [Leptospira noguchii]UOG43935.1 c-type cytochrome [Leptospira noguchii]UOG51419.1 c-type cytochrome [Leptospira noguchii]